MILSIEVVTVPRGQHLGEFSKRISENCGQRQCGPANLEVGAKCQQRAQHQVHDPSAVMAACHEIGSLVADQLSLKITGDRLQRLALLVHRDSIPGTDVKP